MNPEALITLIFSLLFAVFSVANSSELFYKIGLRSVKDPGIKKVRMKFIWISLVTTLLFIGCMSYTLINWRGIDMLSSISVTSIGIITVLSISCSYANRQRKRETKKSSSQKGWIEFD
jgi:hypothetical protein